MSAELRTAGRAVRCLTDNDAVTPPRHDTCADVFVACAEAMRNDVPIRRVSRSDKEFHFQNWVGERLNDAKLDHTSAGRNSYPDFTIVHQPDGYEVKGLQWPGRKANYDSNSRLPAGLHNGRTIHYVFGRYPRAGGEKYPVVDLVICHGDFINANHAYIHRNTSFRGFGSYGDLLVRDRKMYVPPTPFALTDGTTGQATLITTTDLGRDRRLKKVGEIVRVEAEHVVVGYTFDLRTNILTPHLEPNPSAGAEFAFTAYRLRGADGDRVRMKDPQAVQKVLAAEDEI
jgi:hypothetical protein